MNDRRYLTKSRFKSALECPSKLYYKGNENYADNSKGDKFLSVLAEGGYQVGELSKSYHPDASEVLSEKTQIKTNYYSINYFCLTDERGPPYYMITSKV